MTYFPFADYWWFYLGFIAFVLVLLALDLGVFHRQAHAVSIREASIWSAVWIGLALAFNFAFYWYAPWQFSRDSRLLQIPGFDPDSASRQVGLEFLTGYVVEKTLSLDNIFVFVVVFTFFAIPAIYQHRVLFYGILGALVFRGIFIALGSALLQYHDVSYHADRLNSFTRSMQISKWTHVHHLDQVKSRVNEGLRPALARLEEIQPQLPEWKQEAIDKMIEASKALAADTNDAILAKNEAGTTPPAMNPEYKGLVARLDAHSKVLVTTSDAAGAYAAARLKAHEAGIEVPQK